MSHVRYNFISNAINESALSRAILEEALVNEEIKQVLKKVVTCLYVNVFPLVKHVIENASATSFDQLDENLKKLFNAWSKQHSEEDAPYGALCPEWKSGYLEKNPNGHKWLLQRMEEVLKDNIDSITTVLDLLCLIKIIDSLGFFYEHIPDFPDRVREKMNLAADSKFANYTEIKVMLLPTKEENAIRVKREKLNYAITYGIGTASNKDLFEKDKKETIGVFPFPGKARFEIPAPTPGTEKVFFNLLTQNKGEGVNGSIPLVASVSASTARLLSMILHLELFIKSKENGSKDQFFDVNEAKLFSLLILAYFVLCGFHSGVEVVESINRMIDFVALLHLEGFHFLQELDEIQEEEKIGSAEKKLPYGFPGVLHSYLTPAYADKMLERAQKLTQENAWTNIIPITQDEINKCLEFYSEDEKYLIKKDLEIINKKENYEVKADDDLPTFKFYFGIAGLPGSFKTRTIENLLKNDRKKFIKEFLKDIKKIDEEHLERFVEIYANNINYTDLDLILQKMVNTYQIDMSYKPKDTLTVYRKWYNAALYIFLIRLREAFLKKCSIAHGTILTGPHVKSFLEGVKYLGYYSALFICYGPDEARAQAISKREAKQGIVHSDPELAASKKESFLALLATTYLEYADKLYFYWMVPHREELLPCAMYVKKTKKLLVLDELEWVEFCRQYLQDVKQHSFKINENFLALVPAQLSHLIPVISGNEMKNDNVPPNAASLLAAVGAFNGTSVAPTERHALSINLSNMTSSQPML